MAFLSLLWQNYDIDSGFAQLMMKLKGLVYGKHQKENSEGAEFSISRDHVS